MTVIKQVVKKKVAKKVIKKKVVKKKVVKKVAKKKDIEKSKAAQGLKKNLASGKIKPKKERAETPNSFCRKLLLEKKHTDTSIVSQIKKKFPKSSFKRSWIASKRWDLLNDGSIKKKMVPIPEKSM